MAPIMASTPYFKNPAVEKRLRCIAYISGTLSSIMAVLGFVTAFTRNKNRLFLAIIGTLFIIVSLVSLAAHALSIIGFHIALLPSQRTQLLMNSKWIGPDGKHFQIAVSTL